MNQPWLQAPNDTRDRMTKYGFELNTQVEALAGPLREELQVLGDRWVASGAVLRLWGAEEALWTSSGESKWLGWLGVADEQLRCCGDLRVFAADVRGRFRHAVLLGMGGSSLCPEVLSLSFGAQEGFPELRVVDSTVPGELRGCERAIDLESTLFISASKSGTTLETALLTEHFLQRLAARVGIKRAARHFVAITDPGSRLEAKAKALGFRYVMHGEPSIGGRYSALSRFGLVPAAAMGLDIERLLAGASAMCAACGPDVPPGQNPGFRLGLILGASALEGRDKLTLVSSPKLASLGPWIEQLIAESTGKLGKGIVPVDGEALCEPFEYSADRVFASFSLCAESCPETDALLDALHRLGHPVVRIRIGSLEDIGQEFFRWEFATAVAGSVLGINPFDQPDVESAKVAARALANSYESDGSLPSEAPLLEEAGISLFAGAEQGRRLLADSESPTVASVLRSHLSTADSGDYVALLAFVRRSAETHAALARMRRAVGALRGVATCVGFGPRFLHSTGQLHKGGPDSGVFVQIGGDDGDADIPVPGRDLSFGIVKSAQALGDFHVLTSLRRRALRIHLSGPLTSGLERLERAFDEAAQ